MSFDERLLTSRLRWRTAVLPWRSYSGPKQEAAKSAAKRRARTTPWPVCRSYDSAEFVRESPACMPPTRFPASRRGPRLMGPAASRAGDGLVLVHEHPHGARLVTQHGKELVAERIWPEEHVDVGFATNGRRIVVSELRRTELSCYGDWSLGSPTTWSLALRRIRAKSLGSGFPSSRRRH